MFSDINDYPPPEPIPVDKWLAFDGMLVVIPTEPPLAREAIQAGIEHFNREYITLWRGLEETDPPKGA